MWDRLSKKKKTVKVEEGKRGLCGAQNGGRA